MVSSDLFSCSSESVQTGSNISHEVRAQVDLPMEVTGRRRIFKEAIKALSKQTSRGAESGRITPKKFSSESPDLEESSGLLHLTSLPATSDYDYQQKVLRLLDSAIGIRKVDDEKYEGRTLTAHIACQALPVYLVRPVEIEYVARELNCTEMEIGRLQRFLSGLCSEPKRRKEDWDVTDVLNKDLALDYLTRATIMHNKFAKNVLQWLDPETAQYISPVLGSPHAEYVKAIRNGNRDRAILLGSVIPGGEINGAPVRPYESTVLKLSLQARKGMAANNIAYMLVHGLGETGRDVGQGIEYYEEAIKRGSAAAASNLGHLYYSGADGEVKKDGRRARDLYSLAIEKGERGSAPRNMALLYFHGTPGIRPSISEGLKWLLLGLREGDFKTRMKCVRTMHVFMQSWRYLFVHSGLKRECSEVLQTVMLEMKKPSSFAKRRPDRPRAKGQS